MSVYDLVIRNGQIFDGSGAAPLFADIGIREGVITDIGDLSDVAAGEVIDAAGLIITPGFVDVHTHYDGQATWDNRLAPNSSLGSTTVVMGNCGVGFAPCRPEDREVLVQLMEGVEEIPGSALAEGIPWTWVSFPEYLDELERIPRDIDTAALLPHGPLRVFVMGQRGVNREPATAEDVASMQALARQALDAGAVGFSTSRTLIHRSATGEFIPSYQADHAELKAIGRVLDGSKNHVFQMVSDWDEPDAEFDVLRETCRRTGAKATFTLLIQAADDDPDPMWRQHLVRIEEAEVDGLTIRGQVLTRPVGMIMGHTASMCTFSNRPTLDRIGHLPLEELVAKLREPAVKQQILAEESVSPHVFVTFFGKRFEGIFPMEEPINYLPDKDQSVLAMATAEHRDPEEWLYDYLLENEGRNLVYIPATNFSRFIPDVLGHELTVPALGDGGAHVGSICDASAALYLLIKWVKEKQAMPLPTAIQKLTRKPAELYGFFDRGLIKCGKLADLNVIDFDALALATPHIVNDLPAGGHRFLQKAIGLTATIKSGQVIYRDGEPTGKFPGRLLRGHQPESATTRVLS